MSSAITITSAPAGNVDVPKLTLSGSQPGSLPSYRSQSRSQQGNSQLTMPVSARPPMEKSVKGVIQYIYNLLTKPPKRKKMRKFALQAPWDMRQIFAYSFYLVHIIWAVITELTVLPIYTLIPVTIIYCVLWMVTITMAIYLGFSDAADPSIYKKIDNTEVAEGKNYCTRCEAWIDMTCKHCKVCNKCVTKFDHHCRYLNTCIGKKNYKVFFMLISAAVLSMIWTIIVKAYIIIDFIAEQTAYNNRVYERWGTAAPAYIFVILHALPIIPTFVVLYRILDLLLFHVELIRKHQTTYEHILWQRSHGNMAPRPLYFHLFHPIESIKIAIKKRQKVHTELHQVSSMRTMQMTKLSFSLQRNSTGSYSARNTARGKPPLSARTVVSEGPDAMDTGRGQTSTASASIIFERTDMQVRRSEPAIPSTNEMLASDTIKNDEQVKTPQRTLSVDRMLTATALTPGGPTSRRNSSAIISSSATEASSSEPPSFVSLSRVDVTKQESGQLGRKGSAVLQPLQPQRLPLSAIKLDPIQDISQKSKRRTSFEIESIRNGGSPSKGQKRVIKRVHRSSSQLSISVADPSGQLKNGDRKSLEVFISQETLEQQQTEEQYYTATSARLPSAPGCVGDGLDFFDPEPRKRPPIDV